MSYNLDKLINLNNRLSSTKTIRLKISSSNIHISPDNIYTDILFKLIKALIDDCKGQMHINNKNNNNKTKMEYQEYMNFIKENSLEILHLEYEKNRELRERMIYIDDDKLSKIFKKLKGTELLMSDNEYADIFVFDEGLTYSHMYSFMQSYR